MIPVQSICTVGKMLRKAQKNKETIKPPCYNMVLLSNKGETFASERVCSGKDVAGERVYSGKDITNERTPMFGVMVIVHFIFVLSYFPSKSKHDT